MKGRIWEVCRVSYKEVTGDLGAVLRRGRGVLSEGGAGSFWDEVRAVWAFGWEGSGVGVF